MSGEEMKSIYGKVTSCEPEGSTAISPLVTIAFSQISFLHVPKKIHIVRNLLNLQPNTSVSVVTETEIIFSYTIHFRPLISQSKHRSNSAYI